MLINADIGEMMGSDEEIMPFLGMGNIACGGHASNPQHMADTVELAIQAGVKICAHPGYNDRKNFGRISVDCTKLDLLKMVEDQVTLLNEICLQKGGELSAIKPHGALYHDMMRDKGGAREVMLEVAKKFETVLVVQAGGNVKWGVEVMQEVFADRGYRADGSMLPRSEAGSLYNDAGVIVEQARKLINGDAVSAGGIDMILKGDTVCFHGDNPASVDALKLLHSRC